MPTAQAPAFLKSASKSAKVLRCTCTDTEKSAPDWHARLGLPCPKARVVDLGTLAYWHRNPLRRFLWRVSQWLRGRRPGRFHFSGD